MYKKNKGITIISLVITIIVVLILTGISISTLTGPKSIIGEAKEAKDKTKMEDARKQISIEVAKSFNKYGNLSLSTLKTKLESLDADVSDIEDISIVGAQTGRIILDGYEFYVDKNSNVLDYSGPVNTEIPEVSTNPEFSRENGRIDIIFLNGTGYTITETPNKPALDNTMVPVYYDGSDWIVCSENDANWYNYYAADVSNAGTSAGDTKQSKWANVMLTDDIEVQKNGTTYTTEQIKTLITANNLNEIIGAKATTHGSMLVWIPRYAYKITYYDNTKTTVIGYSDSRGIVDAEGKTPSTILTPTTSINVNGEIGDNDYEYYKPHPAFETDLNQGGWSTRITGIWVGKCEVTGTINEITTLTSYPNKNNIKAITYETTGAFYNAIRNNFKAGTLQSHMMKNSEWGAISYLAESKYGRNENAIARNTNANRYTGGGNYKNNQNQSTTGNVYGVYDTVGCCSEYVSSYIANNQNSNGYQFASNDGIATTKNNKTQSTKYVTVYSFNNISDTNENNYRLSLNKIFGDAICETSKNGNGTEAASWHNAVSDFVNSSIPFFERGGGKSNTNAGLFNFNRDDGAADGGRSSRVVCIVK